MNDNLDPALVATLRRDAARAGVFTAWASLQAAQRAILARQWAVLDSDGGQ